MRNVAKRVWVAMLLAGVALMVGQTEVRAQDKPVTATDGWVALPEPGATGTAAYANVVNPGMYAIYLISGTTDVAGKVEFRDASKGTAPQEDISVLQYDTTYMNPKGVHIYLSDLKRPLKEGETISIQLKTELGLPVDVQAVVKKP